MQNLQFQQQLALNKETSVKTVDQYAQQAMSAVTGGQNTVQAYTPSANMRTAYGSSPTTQATASTTPTGSVTGLKKWDPNTGTFA